MIRTPKRANNMKRHINEQNTSLFKATAVRSTPQDKPTVLIAATATRGTMYAATPQSRCEYSETVTPKRTAATSEMTMISSTLHKGGRKLPMNMVISQVAKRRNDIESSASDSTYKTEPELPDLCDSKLDKLFDFSTSRPQRGSLPRLEDLMRSKSRNFRSVERPEEEIHKAFVSIYGDGSDALSVHKKLRLNCENSENNPQKDVLHICAKSYVDQLKYSSNMLYGSGNESSVILKEDDQWQHEDSVNKTNETQVIPQEHNLALLGTPEVDSRHFINSSSFLNVLNTHQSSRSQWSKYLKTGSKNSVAGTDDSYNVDDDINYCEFPVLPETYSEDKPESAKCDWLFDSDNEDAGNTKTIADLNEDGGVRSFQNSSNESPVPFRGGLHNSLKRKHCVIFETPSTIERVQRKYDRRPSRTEDRRLLSSGYESDSSNSEVADYFHGNHL